MRFYFSFVFLALLSAGVPIRAESIRFDRDIRPILSDKCFFCHGPDGQSQEAGLRLDLEDQVRETIVAGDASASELIRRITSTDADQVMPPADSHKELSANEIELLTRWVSEGAQWSHHWSLIPPAKIPPAKIPPAKIPPAKIPPAKPAPTQSQQIVRNPIDAFVARRLTNHRLQFSPEADREKLIRRITFDLAGLPPTIEEIDAFVSDTSSGAYERLVDRLLQSPRYGQRMALAWMDAARYGDTSVYHADGPRDMWAWRDAIVDAYNDNLPFDQFSICQIAGDLLPDASLKQQVLAGFNRNNGTTDEGGAIAEEYRVEYAVDRVKTTSTVWLGLTMECAQCHDHKYDPISQEDYYRFYAFFNISSDAGMQTRKGNAEPALPIPDPDKQQQLPDVEKELADSRDRMQLIEDTCADEFAQWLQDTESSCQPLDAAIAESVVHVSLIEGQGNSIADSIDRERHNEIKGNAKWVKSRYDWALEFNGGNYVDLGNVADFERTDSFSYGGWVKPQKGASGALLARMDDANSHRGFDMLVGDGPISVHIINTWPSNAIKVVTKKKLKPNQWQHVFATYDGSSQAKGIKIYVDGEIWDWKVERNGLTDTIKTDKSLLIGSRHPGARLKGSIDEVAVYHRQFAPAEVQALFKTMPIQALLSIEPDNRNQEQTKTIQRYYLSSENEEYQTLKTRSAALTAQVEELRKPLTSVMVMRDMEKPRETFILNRGAYDSPTDRKVQPGTPAALPPMATAAPRNRLGLAQWLFQEDHPMTARVAVNRYWQMLFGAGLVATPEDFGAQGEFPSHPDLLDWLAVDFQESGWDVKRCIKQMVMSQTYRQSPRSTPKSYRSDPNNRWLARGSRFRLQGEFIRDAALSVSGLLVDKFGGPGVKPYQPAGLWAEVGLGGNPKFVQDSGDRLYRRSLYTYWKRSAPPPAMQIFDAPTREKCMIRRARTNTPLQALVTLNDVQFVEAARHFAERMILEGGKTTNHRIDYGFRLATARRPTGSERKVLRDVLDSAQQQYARDVESAKSLLALGESSRDEALDPSHHAAWTIVASTILNLDETLTRE